MRDECDELFDQFDWLNREEVKHVRKSADGRFALLKVIVAIGYHDEIDPWEIGFAAWVAWGKRKGSGFSPGVTKDEERRRLNFASGASKARNKWGPELLQKRLEQFRKNGGELQSVSLEDISERCDYWIMNGSSSDILRAVKIKSELFGNQDPDAGEAAIKLLIARVGVKRVRKGFEELDYGVLEYKYPDLFEVEDHDAMLEQKNLEDGDEQSGPATRRAGADIGNSGGGGLRRAGDDAAGKMDRGPENAGGAGAGQRRVSSGDIGRRMSEKEARP